MIDQTFIFLPVPLSLIELSQLTHDLYLFVKTEPIRLYFKWPMCSDYFFNHSTSAAYFPTTVDMFSHTPMCEGTWMPRRLTRFNVNLVRINYYHSPYSYLRSGLQLHHLSYLFALLSCFFLNHFNSPIALLFLFISIVFFVFTFSPPSSFDPLVVILLDLFFSQR